MEARDVQLHAADRQMGGAGVHSVTKRRQFQLCAVRRATRLTVCADPDCCNSQQPPKTADTAISNVSRDWPFRRHRLMTGTVEFGKIN
jgi:hypothetical protein